MKTLAYGAALAILLSGSAFAADLVVAPLTPVTVDEAGFDWSGLYAGAQVGYATGRGVVNIPFYSSTFDVDVNGLAGGLHVGANAQFDQFVIGVEIAGNWLGANGRALSGAGTEEYLVNQNWDGSVVGRLGFAADSFLVYGLGGGAVTSITTNYDPPISPDHSSTVMGWTVGAGAAFAIAESVSAGVEYRYTDYAVGAFMHGGPSTVDLGSHTVKARLSFHF